MRVVASVVHSVAFIAFVLSRVAGGDGAAANVTVTYPCCSHSHRQRALVVFRYCAIT